MIGTYSPCQYCGAYPPQFHQSNCPVLAVDNAQEGIVELESENTRLKEELALRERAIELQNISLSAMQKELAYWKKVEARGYWIARRSEKNLPDNWDLRRVRIKLGFHEGISIGLLRNIWNAEQMKEEPKP